MLLINFSNDTSDFNLTPIAYQPQKPPKGILPFVAILLGIRTTPPLRRHAAKVRSIPQTMLSKSLHKATRAHVWIENRKTIRPLDFNIHFLQFTTISVICQRFLTPKQSFNNEIKRKPLDLKCMPNITNIRKEKPSQTTWGSTGSILVRTTGLVVSNASVIAERANLFAEVIVYAQRFVASNNATHSRDESHNRWLCPLRSISANASACFSLRLRSAAQRAGAHGVCRQCLALSQVLLQTKDMKKRTEIIRFVFVSFGADNRT